MSSGTAIGQVDLQGEVQDRVSAPTRSDWHSLNPSALPDPTLPTELLLNDLAGLQRQLAVLERATAFAATASTAHGSLESVLGVIAEAARDALGAKVVVVDILGGDGGSRHSLQSGAPSGNSSGPCMAFLRDAIGQNDAAHDQELIGPTTLPLGFIRIVVPKNARQVTSFVGAPIELGGKSIGTLYRDESAEVGESLAQNNELMARISTITGRLIDHALILNHSEMETRWINAASILTMRLLEGDTDLPLSLITDVAVGATVTDVVMLTTLHGDQVELLASSGRPSEFLKEFQLQREGSLTEHVMQSGEAVFTDNHDGPSTPSFDGASVVAAPLGSKGSIRGVLCLIRERGTVSFTHQELEFVEMFAHRASLALEVIEGRNVRMELAVLEKQKQIAQDLHAHVIREIFGTGMNLQSLARRLNRSEDAKEVQDSIAALDSVIVKIRAVIFDLGTA